MPFASALSVELVEDPDSGRAISQTVFEKNCGVADARSIHVPAVLECRDCGAGLQRRIVHAVDLFSFPPIPGEAEIGNGLLDECDALLISADKCVIPSPQ